MTAHNMSSSDAPDNHQTSSLTTFGTAARPFLDADWPPNALLPGIPPGAVLASSSVVKEESVGKVPGRFLGRRWAGLKGAWATKGRAGVEGLEGCEDWPTGNVCVAGHEVCGFDIDSEDVTTVASLATAFAEVARELLTSPRTRGGSSRQLLPFMPAGPGAVRSWAVRFTRGGEAASVEVKGHGTQWVATGTHPSGSLYIWPAWIPSALDLPVLTEDDSQALRLRVIERMQQLGWTVAGSASGTAGERHALGGPRLVSEETLARVLEALPNDGGWDEGVRVLAAVRGVLGRDGASWPESVLQWVRKFSRGNDDPEGWLEARWRSFDDGVTAGVGGFVKILREAGLDELAGEVDREAGAIKVRELFEDEEVAETGSVGEPGEGGPEGEEGLGEPPPETVEVLEARVVLALERIINGWVYVAPTGEWFELDTGTFYAVKAFNDAPAGRELTLADQALRLERARERQRRGGAEVVSADRKEIAAHVLARDAAIRAKRVAYGRVYAYGDPAFVRLDLGGGKRWLANTALPVEHNLRPVTDSDVRLFLRHAEVLIPDEEERRHVLDMMAWVVQNPTRKLRWALALFGPQGMGKDTLLSFLCHAVGRRHVAEVTAKQLSKEFTSYFESRLVLVSETPGAEKVEIYERVKSAISGTGAGIQFVERKGVDPYPVPDRSVWVFLSNHTNAIAMAPDDRRFYVVRTREEAIPEAESYFRDLHAWREGGGENLVVSWLAARDVSAFDPNRLPGITDAKLEMTRAALPKFTRWLLDELEDDRTAWGRRTVVSPGEVVAWAERNKADLGSVVNYVNESQVVQALQMAGWTRLPERAREPSAMSGGYRRRRLLTLYVARREMLSWSTFRLFEVCNGETETMPGVTVGVFGDEN